jgi:DNA polymerase-3 subunit epsilon
VASSFTAIDVETANADFASICQVGIARFDSGAVVDEWQSFVNPEDYFDAVNVSIHGITEKMVASAPTMPKVYESLTARLDGQIVICHTAFDRVSLARACGRYQLAGPAVTWLDSARIARRAWPDYCGQKGYGLGRLAMMLSLDFTAHVAVEDAKAAGWVVVRAMADTGLSLTDWLTRVGQPIFPISQDHKVTRPGEHEGPLAGHVAVFTGTLSMVRGAAAAMAAAAGCDVREGVTRDTTLLVVGDQDIRQLAGHQKSSKHRKAEALVQGGQLLRIISERDFLGLIAVESTTQ